MIEIEVKNQRIADLETGEKFSCHGTPSVKIKDGFVSENDIQTIDCEAWPCSIDFGDIGIWDMFVIEGILHMKTSVCAAQNLKAGRQIHNFNANVRVYKVKKLVAVV